MNTITRKICIWMYEEETNRRLKIIAQRTSPNVIRMIKLRMR